MFTSALRSAPPPDEFPLADQMESRVLSLVGVNEAVSGSRCANVEGGPAKKASADWLWLDSMSKGEGAHRLLAAAVGAANWASMAGNGVVMLLGCGVSGTESGCPSIDGGPYAPIIGCCCMGMP